MKLEHGFTVPVGIDDAWQVLLDVRTIAPCMPGAALGEVDGDAFTGTVKVKLGPISMTYAGKASFTTKDAQAHKAVIKASGKDKRGGGTAAATVTATLTEDAPKSTTVAVVTDLNITGKPAQFGRGVMADVGNKLIGQFADCLAKKIEAGELAAVAPVAETPTEPAVAAGAPAKTAAPDEAAAPPAAPTEAAAPSAAPTEAPPKAAPPAAGPPPRRPQSTIRAAEEIDLLSTVGIPPAAKLAGVGVLAFLLGVLVTRLLGRR